MRFHRISSASLTIIFCCLGASLLGASLKITTMGSSKKSLYKPSTPSDFATFGYASNPTVFGQILRGELKTNILRETQNVLAFEDIQPRAPLHGLVVPKKNIPTVMELRASKDQQLLEEMKVMAHDLIQEAHPEAYETGDYMLCFHIPPFNSVDHLHLHVLAPASSMSSIFRYGKYNPCTRWSTNLQTITTRLGEGSSPTPYSREDPKTTVVSDTVSSLWEILSSSSSPCGGGAN